MEIVSIAGVLICAALLAVLLRGQRPELALCVCLAAGVVVLLSVLRQVTPLLTTLRGMMEDSGVTSSYITVLLKAAGICLLAQLTADTCRDAGETALAAKAELAGKILMLVLAAPLFAQVLQLVTALINGQVGS